MDDGLIEVIGLTTNTLPKLLAGGKGICIGQCKSAVIRTRRTIPMQVDGEASRLNPATIELGLLNQVGMGMGMTTIAHRICFYFPLLSKLPGFPVVTVLTQNCDRFQSPDHEII